MANIDFVNLLSTYQGRINRGKYWLAALIYFVIGIVFGLINYVLGLVGLGIVGLILTAIVNIAVFVSAILIGIKRIHDRNKPGWWIAIFYIGPSVLFAASVILAGSVLMTIFSLAGLALLIWAFVELGCLRGTPGPNQYGPDPLGTPALAAH